MLKKIILFLALLSFCITGYHSLFANSKPVKVALIFDTSDIQSSSNQFVSGVELAIKKYKSLPFVVNTYQSSKSGESVAVATLEAIKEGAQILVVGVTSSHAAIAAKIANERKVILITPYATSPMITRNFPYAFRLCFDDRFQGQKIVQFMQQELQTKRIAAVYDAGETYSSGLAQILIDNIGLQSISLTGKYPLLTSSDINFTDSIEEIRKTKPDIIFAPLYQHSLMRFIGEVVSHGLDHIPIFTADSFDSPEEIKNYLQEKNSQLQVYFVKHSHSKLHSKFNKEAHLLGQDLVALLAKILRKSKPALSLEIFEEQLFKMKVFEGKTGRFIFEKPYHSPKRNLFVMKLNSDGTTAVKEYKP